MGQARQKERARQTFLQTHPYCCFCGGTAATTTEDHCPPRAFFRERKWPEGYVFPACETCNFATRGDEHILALVTRFSKDSQNELDRQEFLKALRAVRNNFPGLLEAMHMRANDKRSALSQLGLSKAPFASFSEVPMVKLPDRVAEALESFSFKLACALHYKHIGEILPPTGRIAFEVRTNATLYTSPIPPEDWALMPHLASMERCKTSLNDQFTYRFGVSKEDRACIFACLFREALSLLLLTFANPPPDLKEPGVESLEVRGFFQRR